MKFKLRDVARGLVLHLAARFRRRFVRADAPVFTLAQEIDFAGFCRRLGEPLDPEIEALIDANLDIFEDVDCYNA